MFVANREILERTAGKYIVQARRLLHFFSYKPPSLLRWKFTTRTFGRTIKPKPKREYFALEQQIVQKMCKLSKKEGDPYIDSVVGRAVLTIAYTTGTRVGGLLPPRDKNRASLHVPVTRNNVRKIRTEYHIQQPKSKTDREGRGRLIIVSPTNCPACPAKALGELLMCPKSSTDGLFSNGVETPTAEQFLEQLRYWLYRCGEKNWLWFSVRSCRKGACSSATMAKMPEHFTDTLGNQQSRAKETYRRTTLAKAQTEFCEYLGSTQEKRLATSKKVTKQRKTPRTRLRNALHWMHSERNVKGRTRLRQALDHIHEPGGRHNRNKVCHRRE